MSRSRIRIAINAAMLLSVIYAGSASPGVLAQTVAGGPTTQLRAAQTLKQSSAVLCVAFSPDGKWLATSGKDSKVRVWNRATGRLDKVLSGPSYIHAIRKVAFSADGKTLVSASEKARLWDVATGKLQRTFSVASPNAFELKNYGPGWAMSVALSPQNDVVASTGQFLTVHAQSPNDDWKQTFQQKFFYGTTTAFTPDGATLIEAGWNGRLNMWDVAALKKGKQLPSQQPRLEGAPAALGKANSISLSADGQFLVVGFGYEGSKMNAAGAIVPNDDDGSVVLWDLATGAVKQSWLVPQSAVLSAAISPDGGAVAAASADRQIRLWDAQTGQLQSAWPQQANANAVAFSPDNSNLVSGDADGQIVIWNLKP